MTLKIDAFPHIVPPQYMARVQKLYPNAYPHGMLASRPSLYDVEDRLRVMDRFPDYVQVLTLAQPPVESLGQGDHAAELARAVNDELAELVRKHDRFVGFACALPVHDPDTAVRELERAVRDLGALGAQIHTNVRGAPLDDPRFEPLWAKLTELDVALWVHPSRGPDFADYKTEEGSKYGLWLALGWPYETSVFMARLVFAGVLDRHPGLRILTHHCGAMIPSLGQRIGKGGPSVKPHEELMAQFKMFYGDTSLNGNLEAVKCGLAFFGADRVIFGTDMPYDDENGVAYIRDTIANVDALEISAADREKIFSGNARRVLGVKVP